MKIKRLDTHDRLLHFLKDQNDVISQGAEDCLKRNPWSLAYQEKSPYIYIFAFTTTLGHDERLQLFLSGKYAMFSQVPEKKLRWQPRLRRPEPQSNSMLFRAKSKTDIVEVCWILPAEELWGQFKKGNVTESDWVSKSINQFKTAKEVMGKPHPEDFSKEKADAILKEVARELEETARLRKLRPTSSEPALSPSATQDSHQE